MASDEDMISRYYDLLEQILLDNNLIDSPTSIFNCDKTGLPLDHNLSSVVAIRGQKHPWAVTSGKKKQITALGCTDTAGQVIQPLVIFSRKP